MPPPSEKARKSLFSLCTQPLSPCALQCARLFSMHPAMDINQIIITHGESTTFCLLEDTAS